MVLEWPVHSIMECISSEKYATQIGPFGSALKVEDYRPTGVPLLRGVNVNRGRFHDDDFVFIDPEVATALHKYKAGPGDVILVHRGTLGKIGLIPRNPRFPSYIMGNSMLRIRCDAEKLLPEFLYYWLTSTEGQHFIFSRAVQVGVPALPTPLRTLRELSLPIPSLEEQTQIVETLGTLDDKIELNRRMNATVEAMAQAVFKEWFVDGAKEDWRPTTLGEHLEVVKGLSYKGSGLADAGIPMHNLNSIYEFGRYKYEGIKWYTGEFRERHNCKAGDVIVANTEQGFDHLLIGSAALVPKRFGDEGIFSHHIYRVRPLPTSYLTNHFIYLLLSHPFMREQVQGYTNGTTVNSLAKEGLERPTFKLPPKALVEKFDAIVAPLFVRQEANYEETQTLTALRDTLLPKLMRGEVRVKQTVVS